MENAKAQHYDLISGHDN